MADGSGTGNRRNTSQRTRKAIVSAAGRLFQQHGYHGTGLAQILSAAGVPKGSFYHYFPGGKADLAVAVIEHASGEVEGYLQRLIAAGCGVQALVRALGDNVARWLEATGCTKGNPVTALTMEAVPGVPAVQAACQAAFGRWRALVADALAADGVAAEQAGDFAQLAIAAVEGAMVLARADGSVRPMRSVTDELARRAAQLVAQADAAPARHAIRP